MKNIVIDFEFCRVNRKQRKASGSKLQAEIIEFGAVMLDEDMKVTGRFQKYVKPEIGSLTEEIQKLTGIKEDMLKNEEKFSVVLEAFVKWIGTDDFTICSWSMSDYKQLSAEMKEKATGTEYAVLSKFTFSSVAAQQVCGSVTEQLQSIYCLPINLKKEFSLLHQMR